MENNYVNFSLMPCFKYKLRKINFSEGKNNHVNTFVLQFKYSVISVVFSNQCDLNINI